MSKLGLKYQLQFTGAERTNGPAYTFTGQNVTIDIYDRTMIADDSATVTVIPLTPAGDPLHIRSIDNDEDKFTPIRASQAEIKFLSDENFGLSIFTDTSYFVTPVGDPRYYVEIIVGTITPITIWKGFLVFDDCNESFMSTPNEVTLTAVDGLSFLSDLPLVMNVTNSPTYYRIADYLCGALSQTGLSLPLNVIFSIREYNNPSDHLFDKIFLWDKMFKSKGVYITAREVIEQILGEEAYLFQWNAEWWIMRVDQMESNTAYRVKFAADGSIANDIGAETGWDCTIEKDVNEIFFSKESTNVIVKRENKYVKETYKLEAQEDVPCNIDFDRGTYIADLPDEVIEGITYQVKKYTWDCWSYNKLNAVQDSVGYIKKYYHNGQETSRTIYCETAATSNTYFWKIDSNERIPVLLHDKIQFNFSFRYSTDLGGGTGHFSTTHAALRLYGDDGTFWNLSHRQGSDQALTSPLGPIWLQTNSTFTGPNSAFITYEGRLENTDFTQWQSMDTETAPMPVSGTLEILLLNANFSNNQAKEFSDLSFEYIPFIAGTFGKFTAITDKAYRSENLVAKREHDVFMSDGIRKMFKGAMTRYNGTDYVLANQFFNWAAVQSTTPDPSYVHSYLHIQTYDVWNQFRNPMRVFQANCQGLRTNTIVSQKDRNFLMYPAPFHRILLGDSSSHTNNKYFLLLTWDFDFFLCEWTGTIAEVFDSNKGKRYDDPEEVKYE